MPVSPDPASDLSFGDFTIVTADERLVGPAGPVRLGNKAFRVLLMLAERDGRLLTKDELFSSVWDGMSVSESALTSVIKELRRALGDRSDEPTYIESVYGRGYRLLPPVARGEAQPRASAPAPVPVPAAPPRDAIGEAPLLAIPAFDDSALRDSDPYLADVLHEEVLLVLSRFRDIRLVSDSDLPSGRSGGRFGERDYRLAVRLLRDGDGVRAFARISRLSSGAIIWADQIALDPANPRQTVEELTSRVAAVALPRLHDDVLRNLPREADDAYDHYFLTQLRMRGLDSLEEALEVAAAWEALIASHPDLSHAYPPLIRLYDTDYCFTGLGATDEAQRRRGYELAHRAIAVDPTDSKLHTFKGWSHLWAGEAALAHEHFEQALELNPYHQTRLIELATGFMFLDQLDRAAALLERCRALTAFSTEAAHEEEGLLHLLREEFDAAGRSLALARRTHPDDRAATGPSVLSELYAMLAAAGAGTADVAERASAWRDSIAARWAGPEPLDRDRLTQWVLFHSPFQEPARREWLLALFDRAMSATDRAPPRTGGRAPRETRSAPRSAAPAIR